MLSGWGSAGHVQWKNRGGEVPGDTDSSKSFQRRLNG